MATYNVKLAKHATLGAGTEDIVNLAAPNRYVYVANRSATNDITVRFDSTTAVAAADDTYSVQPNTSRVFGPFSGSVTAVHVISAGAQVYDIEAYGI